MVSKKLKRYVVAFFLILMGVIAAFLPVLQGWIFICLGLLVIKDDARWVRALIAKIKRRWPKVRPVFVKVESYLEKVFISLGLR